MRVRLLATLDSFNTVVGNYRAFFRAMEPLLASDRPTRILDLAAGHGGFALEAMRIARERGMPIEMTATDLMSEYLALGEEVARREALPVRFAVQDALDLSNLREGEHDVVICTQSLHHFPPSMTARIFREATRVAGRGVVLIDGCRSVVQGLLAPMLGVFRYRDRAFAHDAWVSCRRFYAPEELGLLAGLAVPIESVEAKWMRPAHCLVRWRRR
jgi:ubiquinone/menaquinone biosynthesis C-methylase UbiE